VLRQHSANWDLRFAYELNGACAKQRERPRRRSATGASGPKEDSLENRAAGWQFFGGEVVATRVL
jgi:hypothetical protein